MSDVQMFLTVYGLRGEEVVCHSLCVRCCRDLTDCFRKILKDHASRKIRILLLNLLNLVTVPIANINEHDCIMLVGEPIYHFLFKWKKFQPTLATLTLTRYVIVEKPQFSGVFCEEVESWLVYTKGYIKGAILIVRWFYMACLPQKV